MAVEFFRTFSDYDRQAAEARRRRAMADLLAQQVAEPTQYGPGPTPAAAPLVRGLQAFLAARAAKKAGEAEETALETKTRAEREAAQQIAATGSQIAGRLMGGAPVRDIAPPDASGLGEVAIESRYRKDPEGALAIGMTQRGGEAISKAPLLAAMLANQMKEPTSAAPKTAAQDTMQWNPKTQRWEDIPGAVARIRDIAAAKRPDVVVAGGGSNEPLVTVKGPDGNPILVPRSQAAGMTPYTTRTAAQEIADVERVQTINQKSIDTQAALDSIEELLAHPGRISGTGASSFVSIIPGTAARGFQAQLETFKARTFIPMVSALKGMGALSDAEGKKLSAAVGALDPSMPEQEFERELRKIQKTLYEKARAGGLNVVMPESLNNKSVDLPPPGAVRRKN